MSKFKEGDVVRLNSGGPLMTVADPSYGDSRKSVYVVWFAQGDESKSVWTTFSPEILTLIETN